VAPQTNDTGGFMTSKTTKPSETPQQNSKEASAESGLGKNAVLVDGQIGSQLRQVYGQLLSEPLPDKFSQLLQKLANPEQKK
jgi:hypothetical protein